MIGKERKLRYENIVKTKSTILFWSTKMLKSIKILCKNQ